METISIDEFNRLDIRVGKVISAERVINSDKLISLKLDLGNEIRQVVAGIAPFYTPEELIGKNLVLLANLTPKKIRGIDSMGMILAADVNTVPVLLTTDKPVPAGSPVK